MPLPHFLSEAVYYDAKENPLHLIKIPYYGEKTFSREKLHFTEI